MKKKVTKSAASKKNQKIDWSRHCKNPSDKIKKQLDIIMSKGLPVNDYFSLLNGGSQQLYRYDKSGIPTIVNDNDPDVTLKRIKKEILKITEEIKADIEKNGYVKNTKLHRRFVMAHFFRMLYSRLGYQKALEVLGYEYSWEMAIEEYRVLSILEKNDKECFDERSHFFNKETAKKMIAHDIDSITAKIRNVSHVFIGNRSLTRSQICRMADDAVVYINRMDDADNFREIYEILCEYNASFRIKKSYFKQCPRWQAAYISNGAYYTLKNMIMFHGCHLDIENPCSIEEEVANLKSKINNCTLNEQMVLDVATTNNFNFADRMREIYNR